MSTKRHTVYNAAGAAIPLVTALVTIPLYLEAIGPARYGVLAIAWLLLGNFGLFDFGLGRAVSQRIAVLKFAPVRARSVVFWTALVANLLLGIAGGLLVIPVASHLFGSMSTIAPEIRQELGVAIYWLALAVPLSTVSSSLSGALQGDARFFSLNLATVFGAVAFQVLPLLFALGGHVELWVLIPAVLLARVLSLGALLVASRSYLSDWRSAALSRNELNGLVRSGSWITVTNAIFPVILAADRMIIGMLYGAAAVTSYTVPYQLGERTTLSSYAMASALFPRFASATRGEASLLACSGQRLIAVSMAAPTVVGIVAMRPFLEWWVSEQFAIESAVIGQVLLIGFWFSGFSKIPHLQLQAIGRPDLVAKTLIAQAIPYGLALYVAIATFGALGAAITFAAKSIFDALVLGALTGEANFILKIATVPTAALLAALAVSNSLEPLTAYWALASVLLLAATMAWSWYETPIEYRESIKKVFFRRQ